MKSILFAFLISAALAAPYQGKTKSSAKAASRPAAHKPATPQAPKALTIPAGAVEIEPGLWRHTDSSGKLWHYRRTPFSVVRFEPEPETSPAPESGLKAVDLGDNVRFEKRTPFGLTAWTKKKSELDDQERQALLSASGNASGNKE